MPDQRKRLNIHIPVELHTRANVLRVRQGITLQEWAEKALRAEVERQEAAEAEAERKRRSR